MAPLGNTTPGQSEPGSDGNKGIPLIPQSTSITGSSTSVLFSVISGTLVGESYLSSEIQSVYSAVPAD